MKTFSLRVMIPLVGILIPGLGYAQPSCYQELADGTVVDMSHLCREASPAPTVQPAPITPAQVVPTAQPTTAPTRSVIPHYVTRSTTDSVRSTANSFLVFRGVQTNHQGRLTGTLFNSGQKRAESIQISFRTRSMSTVISDGYCSSVGVTLEPQQSMPFSCDQVIQARNIDLMAYWQEWIEE